MGAAGKSLCDKFGVRGYPTIKFFNPPDEEGEDYKGGRDLESLRKFASTELKKAMADAEEEHNALLKTLQATFKESQEKMEKLKEDSAPQIKLLKAATPGPKKDAAKDEV